MAGHNPCVNKVSEQQIRNIKPKTAVDVGTGSGYYGNFIKTEFPECYVIGVEIYGPYITQFPLTRVYDKMINNDIKNVINMLDGDIIIFGDVLEHMAKNDALYVLDVAVKNFKYILINGPKYFAAQTPVNDNKYEAHVCDIGMKDFGKYNIIESNDFELMINVVIKGEV